MAYTKQTWNNGAPPHINATGLTHIENGIFAAAATADAAQVAADLDDDTAALVGDSGTATGAALTATIESGVPEIAGSKYVVADGVTDNTSGLTSAVAAAMSAGKELVLPPGTIVTGPISITPTAALKIRGSGMGRTIIRLASSASPGHLLRIASGTSHRVMVTDLTLDGNNVAMSSDVLTSILKLDSRNNGATVVQRVEVKNATQSGIVAYNSAIELSQSWIHDCVLEGVTPHANYPTEILNNLIENCTRNGIRIGSSASTTKYDGVLTVVEGNRIRNITDAFAGTGQYGNGILIYRVGNVIVRGNTILNVAWAFIRGNRADNLVVANNSGTTNSNQQGIFIEFNSSYATITGNKITSVDGISVANVDSGAFESAVVGNTVKITGVDGTSRGIWCETGVVANNVIDGGGTCRYGVSQIGGGTSGRSQLTVAGNRISGCKYAIGIPTTNTHADSFTEVSGNKVTRKDANWSSFFGAIGGSSADAGNGSSIGTYAAKLFIDQPTEDVASGAEPASAKTGSRLSIGGVLKTWSGAAWV
jgi:uncharacterized secreted repeat protein (TIGR03808 family)